MRSAGKAGIPVVVSLYGIDITQAPSRRGIRGLLYRRHLRYAFAHASRIIAISESIYDAALQNGAPKEKLWLNHIGIPVITANHEGAQDKSVDILFVGRFVDKKGATDLLEAVSLISQQMPTRVTMVGDGPEETTLRALAERRRLDVCFTGPLPPNEVDELMRRSRVLAAPSRTAENGDSEGLPTVIVEAAMRGMAIVSTWHAGIPEVIQHGVGGLLSNERDPAALAKNLISMLEDDELAMRLGNNARDRALEQFDIAVQVGRTESVYRDVTNLEGRSG